MPGQSLRVVSISSSLEAARQFGPSTEKIAETASDVSDAVLKSSLSSFVGSIQGILEDLPATGNFAVRSFEVQAQITAEGGIELIGSLKAGITGGIKIIFQKSDK